jgi:serine/threonine protein phosphatase 1
MASQHSRKRASVPEGVRIYAVGDVHGCVELLDQVLARIDEDIAAHPVARPIEVFLGDYVDRGPASREVLERLIVRSQRRALVCLKGNHETYIGEFLSDPGKLQEWQHYGGLETLMSYGLTPAINADPETQRKLATEFEHVLPTSHRQFLAGLKSSFVCGDYFFVHAGVRPGVPIARQEESDLLWIRDEFLLHEDGFSKFIIHGHTPVMQPDIRPNRINIDTGAYATGVLTCLILESDKYSLI